MMVTVMVLMDAMIMMTIGMMLVVLIYGSIYCKYANTLHILIPSNIPG